MKGILRQLSVARNPQQNRVAERRNRTLIEAAKTMLADSKLPTTFWAEAVNTAFYVQNRVLVVKPHNKTPYELFHGRTPTLSFMRPFGCLVTIQNTIDYLGKFDGKDDEGFFVGYSLNSKAFRVFNSRTRMVDKNLHIRFSESTPNVVGSGPDWLFDIDALTRIMNYEPIVAGTHSNGFVDLKSSHDDRSKPLCDDGKKVDEDPRKENECNDQEKKDNVNSLTVNVTDTNEDNKLPFDPNMPALENVSTFNFSSEDEDDDTVFRNKTDERGIMIRNKARFVAQGYTQEEDIDYDEVFSPLAKIEAIKMFLAYASFKDFVVYQMDVKSVFLYGKIEEEVYVCQPPGFEDPYFLDRVYKVEKALYELHQAPRPWHKHNILLVKVYMDDIIFGSTKKELCNAFERLMHEKFQNSSMGELTFFLGLQVYRSQDCKYTKETQKPLLKDEGGEKVDVHMCRKSKEKYGKKIIITKASIRRDLQLANEEGVDCLPNSTIFEQLAFMGPKTTAWNEFSSTVASAIICLATNQKFNFSKWIFDSMIRNLDNVSGKFLMYPRSAMLTNPHHTPTILQSSPSQPQKTNKPRKSTRNVTQVPQPSDPMEHVADETCYKELGDSLVRAATTASSFGAEHDSGNIAKTQSKATPNESSSQRSNLGGGPRCQETMRDTTTQTRVKKLEKRNRSRTHNLKRLYKVGLTARVESLDDEESLGEDASKQGRIKAIDSDEYITMVNDQDDVDKDMFDVNVLGREEVFAAAWQSESVFNITTEELTLAQALKALKTSKPKVKGLVTQEPGESTTTTTTISSQQSNDKGKGIMIEEPVKSKKKDQIRFDKEAAKSLQAEFDEEERLARVKAVKTRSQYCFD
uniref:Retrovirus-related Pol polyprotein from transposon TNT 1-94 n=1 Tax=Tanacetum cinerariifolium TaxID=118510 RepID=A0A6L2KF51_TANCI|nr:retrovirus-related Pol polyprotein from transposon TNT 1-94 [Tanacetum cinerariifolium]